MQQFIGRIFLVLAILVAIPANADKGYLSDVGQVAFPNSGAEAAQPHFLRGLALLHNFEYVSAKDEFLRAQDIDPDFAMAYWGEAMTYNHPLWMEQDREAALGALAKLGATAEERAEKAGTERARDWLAAIETLYGKGEKFDRDYAYLNAMTALAAKYPDDVEAQAFHALAIMGTAHAGRDVPKYMQAGAIANELVFRHPQHPGAAHYMIHATDDPEHAFLGLKAARAYSKIAPNAAHAQHMTSHIFLALGMWDETVLANENSVRVSANAFRARGWEPRKCGHYNYWLAYGYLQQARTDRATEMLEACYAQAAATAPSIDADEKLNLRPNIHRSFTIMWARHIIDTEDWDGDLLAKETPGDYDIPAAYLDKFVKALAAARRGDLEGTRQSFEDLKQRAKALSDAMDNAGFREDNPYRTPPRIQLKQIEGLVAILKGDENKGLDLLRESAAMEAAAPYEFGPPTIDKPAHELLADMLLETGHAGEAAEVYKTSLLRTRGRVLSQQGLEAALAAAARD